MALRDLTQFLEDDGLDYPLRPSSFEDVEGTSAFPAGKQCRQDDCPAEGEHVHYRVPSPSAKVGLWLASLTDVGLRAAAGGEVAAEDLARLKLDDDGEKTFYQRVMGAVYDEMVADGVKWTVLQRVGSDAYLCFATSQGTADAVLAGMGEAQARTNRATRRAAKKTAGSRSRRASTAGTASDRARTSRTSVSSTSPNAPGAEAAKAAV